MRHLLARILDSVWPAVIVVLAACASDGVSPSAEADLIVVQAYLFVGEVVDDVRITGTVLLGEDPTLAESVDDATVRLTRDGVTYTLQAVGTNGQYTYEGSDLVIGEGERFVLEVERGGVLLATAETVTPRFPMGVALSDDVLQAPTFGAGGGGGGFGGGGGGLNQNALEVTWKNDDPSLHYVVIEGLDPNAEFILPDFVRENFGGFRLVSRPTLDGFFRVNLRTLETLGLHRATVYRVNEEYGDLFENQAQDSRDLNEPPSNVIGALGVFSAFAGVSVLFDVVRE